MAKEGLRPILVPEALFNELQTIAREGKVRPGPAPQPIGPRGCTRVIIIDLDENGDVIVDYRCGGSCGIIDRFLGRSCNRLITGNPDGSDLDVSCTCSGGWFDRIFG